MHYKYILPNYVCEIHKILFYNMMRTCIGTSSIAKYNDSSRIRVFVNQMGIPYVFNIVTDEFRSIVALPDSYVSYIFLHVIDAMRNDFSIGKIGKVMVKSLGLSCTLHSSLTFEVTDEFFLLGVYADDWDSSFNTLLPCFGYVLKLFIPVLHLSGCEAFDKGTLAKPQHIKHLGDYVFRYFNALINELLSDLRLGNCNPIDIFVLRKPCRMVLYNGLNFRYEFGIFVYNPCAASSFSAYSTLVGIILFFDFGNTYRNRLAVKAEKSGNRRDSFVSDSYGADAKIVPS